MNDFTLVSTWVGMEQNAALPALVSKARRDLLGSSGGRRSWLCAPSGSQAGGTRQEEYSALQSIACSGQVSA